MTETTIRATASAQKPNYKKTAAEILQRCREFFQDPENERAFREWKDGRSGKHEQKAEV